MNFYAFIALINALTSSILGLFVLFKNRKSNINRSFFFFCIAVAAWSYAYLFWQIATTETAALFWTRALMAGAIFIPASYLHFVVSFLNLAKEKRKLVISGYVLSFIFFLFNFTPLFVKGVLPRLSFPYWPQPGITFHPFLLLFFGCVIYSWYLMLKAHRESTGIMRVQVRYVFIGTLIGFLGGSTNYFLWYNIPVPPFGNFLVVTYVVATAYAIVKYRLMDIRVAIGKGAVYLFSFATVIGLGLLAMYLNSFFGQPLHAAFVGVLILVLGILLFQPIFRFYSKLAAKYLYHTFYSYQQVLADLGEKSTSILDLKKLSSILTKTLVETMKLDKTAILLRAPKTGAYKIQNILGFREENGLSLVRDNFLTLWLEKTKKPLVFEELNLAIRDARDEKERANLEKLQANMQRIEANLCLPFFIKEKITGIIILGKKLNQEPYSLQDMELLTALSNQAAIALENSRLYAEVEDLSKNLEQRVKEQVKNIEALSEMKSEFLKVVSHQLRTPASIIKGMASMIVEGSAKGKKKEEFIKKLYLSSERLITILDDILVSQRLVGKTETLNLEPLQVEEIIEKAVNQFRTRAEMRGLELSFKKPEKPLSKSLVDQEMLERAIARFIDNAILYTPAPGLEETGQVPKGKIEVSLSPKKEKEKPRSRETSLRGRDFIEIKVKDSGIGLDEKDKKLLFKLFSRGQRAISLHPNGSGLGLFIANEIIKAHQGEIKAESKGRGKGTTFTITLPVITEL